ncbi:MAG: hypothetical protein M1835_004563 [Candelina submexicana]|nr:MAG: hypothetical protein M1835_004563 [Candelina submexicana]
MSRPAEEEGRKSCPKCGMSVRLAKGRDHTTATWATCKCAKANSPSAPAEGQKPAVQAQKKLDGRGPVTKQIGEALKGLGSSEEQLKDLATWLGDGYTIEELGLEGEGLERALALQRLLAIM